MSRDLSAEGWSPAQTNEFMTHIGPIWQRDREGGREFGLLTERKHANKRGIVHGGALMSMLDWVLGATAWEQGGRNPQVTIQMDTQFLDAAEIGDLLIGRAEIQRGGRSLLFMRGVLSTEDGREIAAATGVWKVVKPRSPDAPPGPAD